jgi:hypothetical protein
VSHQARTFAVILGAMLIGPVALELGPLVVGCDIKGNISTSTGERIYHMPGQKYYFLTRIINVGRQREMRYRLPIPSLVFPVARFARREGKEIHKGGTLR